MARDRQAGVRPTDPPPSGWALSAADRTVCAEIHARLPARLFDVHAHLYRVRDIAPVPRFLTWGPAVAGIRSWRAQLGRQVGPGRLLGGLFVPFPSAQGDAAAATRFVLDQTRTQPGSKALILVSPQQTRDQAETLLAGPQVAGFKPYHLLSGQARSMDCRLADYLPEWAWQIADARGLILLLHLVRDRALADADNQADLLRLCRRYPGARVILAHAGRGFHAPNTCRGIDALRDLDNVWFDSSGICEAPALSAILAALGPRRLLWGSDFPVSQQRGRCVTLGTGFAWVTTDQVEWPPPEGAFFGDPIAVGLESLRALLDAADQAGLDAAERDDIFCDNARRLLGLMPETHLTTQALYVHAKRLMPGGTQLLSKRPEMFAPDQWPAYYREARGCEIWDLDGRHFYDLSTHGIGACLLGFRDPDVTRAVQRCVARGSFCTLNPPEEVELAQLLCELHPWASQARFGRTGGEIMAAAVRIARATTDRSVVAICGYHGWHDWYLAANLGEEDSLRGHLLPGLNPLGVPRELRGTALTFSFNDRAGFERLVEAHGPRLAAVVMEPCRHHDPEPGFLEFVRDRAHRVGALLVFDEITIGWRLTLGGSHLRLGVRPDLAVFAKALGNGHPMAAVIGTREAMEGAHASFISSTYCTESVGPVAALAALRKMQRVDVPAHCAHLGRQLQDLWRTQAQRHGLPVVVDDGYPCFAGFSFAHEQANALKTLYIQSMLERGFLTALRCYVTLAHTESVVEQYATAVDAVFAEIADALDRGEVENRLRGPPAHTGFRRLV